MLRMLFVAVFLTFSSVAFALSCAEPQVNQQSIDNADAIFIGTVTKVGDKPGAEMLAPTLYEFTITKSYKGVTEGDTVTIGRVAYYGDKFAENTSYIIFARKNLNDVLMSDLCGLSVQTEFAAPELLELLDAHSTPAQ